MILRTSSAFKYIYLRLNENIFLEPDPLHIDPAMSHKLQLESSEPKLVNPNGIQYRVNSLWLGGLQVINDHQNLLFIPTSIFLYNVVQHTKGLISNIITDNFYIKVFSIKYKKLWN